MSRDSKTYCISSTYYSCAHVFYNKSNESTSALLTDCFEGILWRRQLQISVFHHPISFSLKHLNSSTEKDYNCTIKGSVFISLLPHLRLFFILIKVAQLSSSRPSHPSHIIKAWCDLLESKSNLLRMNMFLFFYLSLCCTAQFPVTITRRHSRKHVHKVSQLLWDPVMTFRNFCLIMTVN